VRRTQERKKKRKRRKKEQETSDSVITAQTTALYRPLDEHHKVSTEHDSPEERRRKNE
jgi:hypothetical protein